MRILFQNGLKWEVINANYRRAVRYFKDELKLIEVELIKKFTQEILSIIPDYFFVIPASSTGKYHPQYGLGMGGLARHTRAAVKIAHELFNLEPSFSQEEKSIILSALILHDGCKNGKKLTQYTAHAHPAIMVDLIREQEALEASLGIEMFDILCGAIASHMGQWNVSHYSPVCLPLPKTPLEHFVHLCDYLASRKFIEIIFNEPTKN